MKKRSVITLIVYLVVLGLLFAWITGIFGGGVDDLPYSRIVKLLEEGKVKEFVVQGQKIYLELHDPYNGKTSLTCNLADPESSDARRAEKLLREVSVRRCKTPFPSSCRKEIWRHTISCPRNRLPPMTGSYL